ncbi:response regulator [Candidatus Albibeggiatoa sp. nov. NOAA]|uniref:response regulator n=1 Tax=Candidatus Albibeggiatoa sp. nov. NOAA TaxID=3162724 RepID=UPI0032F98CB1|nr:response regulator [Thiotrichaceae bacterium]
MPTLLLAEDNAFNQKVAATMLKKLGFEVEMAQNGQEALDKVAANGDYGLLFMDCEMPVMDGYQSTQKIRELEQTTGKHIPIIAMTAHSSPEDRQQCLDSGMDDYIAKPFKIDALKGILEKWNM